MSTCSRCHLEVVKLRPDVRNKQTKGQTKADFKDQVKILFVS